MQVFKSIDALLGGDRSPSGDLPYTKSQVSRRGALIGVGALAVAAGAGGVWWMRESSADHPSPEATLLLQKGIDALQSDDVFEAENPGTVRDAIALLAQAVQVDPRSAEAWGSLALAYAALKRVSPPSLRPGLKLRSQSAASKAFEIETHEPRATGALLLLKPLYRNWLSAEREDRRALKEAPKRVPLLIFVMSDMLRSVGRCKEAAAVSATFNRRAFIIPGADEQVLLDLWSAGDLPAADDALQLAVQHWPQHPQVWRTRISYLMYSGRASEALQLLRNETERPPATPVDLVKVMDATASALAGQGNVSEAIALNLTYLKANPLAPFQVAHACSMLGDAAEVFPILEGYFFAQGPWSDLSPRAGIDDRQTGPLFQPPMKSVWSDPRFNQLLQRTGLEQYWRESKTRPDFRVGAAS